MKINGKEYELRITGKTLLVYKETFKKNLLNVERGLINGTYDALDIYEIVYAILKASGQMDGRTYSQFVEDTLPSEVLGDEAMDAITEAIVGMFNTTEELKKN